MNHDPRTSGASEDRERYERLHAVLDRARALAGIERETYLNEACGGDAELFDEVQELLALADRDSIADAFSDQRVGGVRQALEKLVDGATDESVASRLPRKIARYSILDQLGEGGMGIVYEAVHEDSQRRVALKVIRSAFADDRLLRRFRREVRILGQLQHPGIAQVLDSGTHDQGSGAQPYLAMELVDGKPIDEYASENELDVPARLELVARIADALHHAHEKGIIHRDLKPSNILVEHRHESSGTGRAPARSHEHRDVGRPKLLDFGVARATGVESQVVTLQTVEGQLVGTVPYMSPEQASGDLEALDRTSDVYALGVIAFELLAGSLPYGVRGKLVHEAVRVIREDEPSSLGAHDSSLRGDVETIIAKALEKDPGRRYATAAEFADDLRRHIGHLPIHARPQSTWYQLSKFARRNKALVGGMAATLLVALVGAGVATKFALDADRRAAELERLSYRTGLSAAQTAIERSEPAEAATWLESLPAGPRGWEYDYLQAQLDDEEMSWDAPSGPILRPPVIDEAQGLCHAVMAPRLGKIPYGDGPTGILVTWEISTGRTVRTIPVSEDVRVANRVLINVVEQEFVEHTTLGTLRFRDLVTGRERRSITAPIQGDQVRDSLQNLDSAERPLIFGGASGAWSWDGREWSRLVGNASGGGDEFAYFETNGHRVLAYGNEPGVVPGNHRRLALLDLDTGATLARRAIDDSPAWMSFSPDGRWIAWAGFYAGVFLLDANTLETVRELHGHEAMIRHLAWSRDSSRFATTSDDGTVRLWSIDSPESVVLSTHERDAEVQRTVTFLPGDRGVLVTNVGARVVPIPDAEDRGSRVLHGLDSFVYRVAFSPDGTLLASSGFQDPEIHVWSVATARPWRVLRGPSLQPTHSHASMANDTELAFSEDSRRLVASNLYETLAWDLFDTASVPESRTPPPLSDLSFGDLAGELGERRWARIGTALNRPPDPALLWHMMSVSADRTWVAVRGREPCVMRLTDAARRQLPAVGTDGDRKTRSGVSHPDQLEDHGAERFPLTGHDGEVLAMAFHPDGSRLATGGRDQTIRIWDLATRETLLVLRGHGGYVMDLAFSPDGSLLASASGDKTIRLWDTKTASERRADGTPDFGNIATGE